MNFLSRWLLCQGLYGSMLNFGGVSESARWMSGICGRYLDVTSSLKVFKSGCCESSGCGMDFSPGCRAKLCCVSWKKNKVFNYVDKLPRSVNLCSPFSSHIPYSAKQQVLRGSLELRKQWFPGFLWHSTIVVLWFQQPAFISKVRRVKSVAKRSKTGPIFCVPCGCWGLSKIELVHFVHLEFDEGHEGCYVFFFSELCQGKSELK